jgi:hypothetical protein
MLQNPRRIEDTRVCNSGSVAVAPDHTYPRHGLERYRYNSARAETGGIEQRAQFRFNPLPAANTDEHGQIGSGQDAMRLRWLYANKLHDFSRLANLAVAMNPSARNFPSPICASDEMIVRKQTCTRPQQVRIAVAAIRHVLHVDVATGRLR